MPTHTILGYRDNKGVLVNKNNNLKYIAATHYVLGIEYKPNALTRLNIEGFFKQYNSYPVSINDSIPLSTSSFEGYSVGDEPIKSIGRGRAYGGEISYTVSQFHNTLINTSYTLLFSEFNKMDNNLKPVSGQYIRSSWDVRHIINITAIHNFNKNWDLGFKWNFTGGSPYTPYDYSTSSLIDAWDARQRPYYDYSRLNTMQFNSFHQLSMRVDKTWFFNKWTMGIYFDIQNIYNSKTDSQDVWIPEVDSNKVPVVDPNDPNRYKLKSIKGSSGGTVLPTLGIIISF